MAKMLECPGCGAIISSKNKYCPECRTEIHKKKHWWLLILIISIVALSFFPMGGSGTPGIIDRLMDIVQSNDEHVRGVKYGHPNSYPDISYEEAFNSFFGSPTWKFFQGTQEGSDEIHDVVEFAGTCMYQNVEVKARMQFTLHEDGTFEVTHLSFNDVPQSRLIMLALIEKAFTSYQEMHRG